MTPLSPVQYIVSIPFRYTAYIAKLLSVPVRPTPSAKGQKKPSDTSISRSYKQFTYSPRFSIEARH